MYLNTIDRQEFFRRSVVSRSTATCSLYEYQPCGAIGMPFVRKARCILMRFWIPFEIGVRLMIENILPESTQLNLMWFTAFDRLFRQTLFLRLWFMWNCQNIIRHCYSTLLMCFCFFFLFHMLYETGIKVYSGPAMKQAICYVRTYRIFQLQFYSIND